MKGAGARRGEGGMGERERGRKEVVGTEEYLFDFPDLDGMVTVSHDVETKKKHRVGN